VRNHDEKIKDMSRSVLPSTGRKGARDDRRLIHKRQRTRERVAVMEYRRAADRESVAPDLRGAAAREITDMVWHRRGLDKVGPLIRWAKARIAADPVLRAASVQEQVGYFARLMPSTSIGRHAITHIESALEWRARNAVIGTSFRSAPDGGPRFAETERLVRRILAAGLHGTLNDHLRRLIARQSGWDRATGPVPHRMLLGDHDVEAFVAETARWPAVREVIAAVAAAA
jgi:hypothetical protein